MLRKLFPSLRLPPRFTMCFACTLVAAALAFAFVASQGAMSA